MAGSFGDWMQLYLAVRRRRRAGPGLGYDRSMSSLAVDLERVVSLAELEALAAERLRPQVLDFLAGGSWDEASLRDNRAAFGRFVLRPRVLTGTTGADLGTELIGRPVRLPIGVAPTSQHGHCHPDGETATARAAAAAGAPYVLSMMASRSIEEVAAAVAGIGGPAPWFQLYVQRDLAFARTLVERAAAAGYGALVLSVDMAAPGYRDRDARWAEPLRGHYPNFPTDEGDLQGMAARRRVPIAWRDLATIAGWSSLPLVLKGILGGDDARLAVEHGAAAVWVSNHGGRQLDRVAATIDALAEVVAAVDGRAEVLLDGGVRRGLDVVTAIALGARAVFVGRPALHGLAVGGEAGVRRALAILEEETRRAVILLGASALGDLGPAHVGARSPAGR